MHTTDNTTSTATADLDFDLDELQALCDAVKRPWYGTCQIADGVTDEAAVAFIEAFSPDTVSELIAAARRAAQPVALGQEDERLLRAGRNLHGLAKRLGWPDDGEGAYEYVQRLSYELGRKDATPSPQVAKGAELPIAGWARKRDNGTGFGNWLFQTKEGAEKHGEPGDGYSVVLDRILFARAIEREAAAHSTQAERAPVSTEQAGDAPGEDA